MDWYQFGIFIILGLYAIAVLVAAPYLIRKGRQHNTPTRRERNRQLLQQLRWSIGLCIAILIINAATFLPIAFAGNRPLTVLGIVLLVGVVVFLLLLRYLSHLIHSLEEEK